MSGTSGTHNTCAREARPTSRAFLSGNRRGRGRQPYRDVCKAASPHILDITFCGCFAEVEEALHRRANRLLSLAKPRVTVGLCGIPGSGKSTAAHKLAARVNDSAQHEIAIAVPMDGFHFYRAELDAMSDPEWAHVRRGAAFTFNAEKFLQRMRDLASADTAEGSPPLRLPSFDHGRGDPVEDDVIVLPQHRFVIVEGIYVLRNEKPWSEVEGIFDETWMLRVDKEAALENVFQRKIATGRSDKDARQQVNSNDAVNADEIMSMSLRPHFVVDASAAHIS